MSDVISDPENASIGSPPAAQIDLAALDDKHLGQYRHPNERRALVAIVVGVAAIVVVLWIARPILGNLFEFLPSPFLRFLSTWTSPTRLALVILGLLLLMMVLDLIGQWSRSMQLVAQATELTPTTFPQFAPIVDELRTRFDLPRVRVYVSRDAPPMGYTIGVHEPFAIVFSSIGVGTLTPAEFKFCLGREMGSIKLGHTRMAILMGNVNMSLPQPFSFLLRFRSILFGSYNHAQALSCDRIGVVATRSVNSALSTIIKQNLGTVRGAKIDLKSLAPQTAELNQGISGAIVRTSMLLNSQPFAVARLSEMVAWAGEPAPVVTTAPAAPPPPTPADSAKAAADSAKAAADSAKAAADSAKAAADSAKAVVAAAALLMPSGADASVPPISTASPAAAEPASAPATATQPAAAPAATMPPSTPSDVAAAPAASGTASATSPATEAVAAPAPSSESPGAGAPTPPPEPSEGGTVSVTVPRPPQ